MVSYEELNEIEVENVFQEPLLFQGGETMTLRQKNNTHISCATLYWIGSDGPGVSIKQLSRMLIDAMFSWLI